MSICAEKILAKMVADAARGKVVELGVPAPEPAGAAFDNVPDGTEDWRQNNVILERIFYHLPLPDIKACRFVCKLWAAAAAVPLSHKSTATSATAYDELLQGSRKNSSFRGLHTAWITKVLDFERTKVWDTGLRLRHLELQLTTQEDWKGSFLQIWSQFFSSDSFQTVESLRLNRCPVNLVRQQLLPYCLPRYWSKLKSLKLCATDPGHRAQFLPKGPKFKPRKLLRKDVELETFGLEWPMDENLDWSFMVNCPKLKSFKFIGNHCLDTFDKKHPQMQNAAAPALEDILRALAGKQLRRLSLTGKISRMFINGPPHHQQVPVLVSDWKSFYDRLVSANLLSLRQLTCRIKANLSDASGLSAHLQFPPNLKKAKFEFSQELLIGDLIRRDNPCDQELPCAQVLRNLLNQGYVALPEFELTISESHHQHRAINIQSVDQKRLILRGGKRYTAESWIFKPTQDLVKMLHRAFPKINYMCYAIQMPKGADSLETELFETIGQKDGNVFDIGKMMDQKVVCNRQLRWDMPERNSWPNIVDHQVIAANAASVWKGWKAAETRGPKAKFFIFDHIPAQEMEQVYTKILTTPCETSSVRKDVPAATLAEETNNGKLKYNCRRVFSSSRPYWSKPPPNSKGVIFST